MYARTIVHHSMLFVCLIVVSDQSFATRLGHLAMPLLLHFPTTDTGTGTGPTAPSLLEASKAGLLSVRRVLFFAYLAFPEVCGK
jgi:hypothetical protein